MPTAIFGPLVAGVQVGLILDQQFDRVEGTAEPVPDRAFPFDSQGRTRLNGFTATAA